MSGKLDREGLIERIRSFGDPDTEPHRNRPAAQAIANAVEFVRRLPEAAAHPESGHGTGEIHLTWYSRTGGADSGELNVIFWEDEASYYGTMDYGGSMDEVLADPGKGISDPLLADRIRHFSRWLD